MSRKKQQTPEWDVPKFVKAYSVYSKPVQRRVVRWLWQQRIFQTDISREEQVLLLRAICLIDGKGK